MMRAIIMMRVIMIICSTYSIIIMLINYNDENNDESNNNNLLRLLPLLLHRHRRHRHFDQDRSWFLVARSSRTFCQDERLLPACSSILSATSMPLPSKLIHCCNDLRWDLPSSLLSKIFNYLSIFSY